MSDTLKNRPNYLTVDTFFFWLLIDMQDEVMVAAHVVEDAVRDANKARIPEQKSLMDIAQRKYILYENKSRKKEKKKTVCHLLV